MSIQPCIICDKQLGPVMRLEDHMPYEATLFQSNGNYGSTIWDPMDGSYIEITICDECLRSKANKILVGRTHRSIKTTTKRGEIHVGTEAIDRPMIEWNPDENSYNDQDVLFVEPEEVGTDMSKNIRWYVKDLPKDWWEEG